MKPGVMLWWSAAVAALTGCSAPLPRYGWTDGPTALARWNDRHRTIRTFSATCRILLERDGEGAALRGVIVARPPDRLRLRAWKFSQVVLDITMNPDGLFVYQHDAGVAPAVSYRAFAEAKTLLPGFSAHVAWQVEELDGRRFARFRVVGDRGDMIRCVMDKATLLTRRCTLRDGGGAVRQSLEFGDYRLIDGTPWPRRIRGEGVEGAFEITFDRVTLNQGLPERAFDPPKRAVRQP